MKYEQYLYSAEDLCKVLDCSIAHSYKVIRELNKECKKTIDVLGINEYNVGKISDYAEKMLDYGRYDEVEAEYMTIIKSKGKEL